MDFGALPAHRDFDTSLPPRHSRERPPATALDIRIGAAQWSIPSWVGRYYPKGTKGAEQLTAYARQWNSIELNTSFYAIPSPTQVETWGAKTPEDFRFFVKVFQGLSHDPEAWSNPRLAQAKLREFLGSWTKLGSRLGGFFYQLPPEFHAGNAGLLARFLDLWPREFPLAVELRHPTWFESRNLKPEFFDLLEKRGVGTSIVDTPGRRDVSHGSLTNDRLFIRCLTQSSEEHAEPIARDLERLDAWAEWIADSVRAGIRQVAFFPHSPDQYWAPYFSTRFAEKLERALAATPAAGLTVRRPQPIQDVQMSLF